MEWWLTFIIIFGSLILLMLAGLPIAFCFMLINVVGVLVWWGGTGGLHQLVSSIFSSLAVFALLPLLLFILMGEVMYHSQTVPAMIEALDKWLGRLPGRLGLLSVGAGTLLGALTGNTMAAAAMLGSTLVPEMERRGYQKPMSLGPILGSAGLSAMIPPSGLAVLLGFLGQISIGKLLMAIIVPGLLMAGLYAAYIITRCKLQPYLAPPYVTPPTSLVKKLLPTMRHILPIGIVVFLVIGVIILGVATPSEAAASGAVGTFVLAAIQGKFGWKLVKKAAASTASTSTMIFMIIAGALAYSQLLAFTGATRGLVEFSTGLPLPPIAIIIGLQLIVVILGMFIEQSAIMMITLPMFMPVVTALGFNPVWFGAIYLINMVLGGISPPFGLTMFVMKGVAPPDTTMGDIYRAAMPFVYIDLIAMALVTAFPSLALWLPGLMRA
ncbi:MAG: TRAP transporter large permease subunit [Chloroflexi bacterium]|nr:TRAP transporter large permease subunit [Chloroflexota bacterium]